MASIVTLKNICSKINDNALHNVDLEIEEGSILGVLGDNYSGRENLLKVISGVDTNVDGEATVIGQDITSSKYINGVGASLGIDGFILEYSGIKNLKILASINDEIDENEIENIMYTLSLSGVMNEKVREYDLSMKKRLSIAQAIMERPKLLVIDEPFMHLEANMKDDVLNILKKTRDTWKTTIVVGSKNEEDLKVLCNSICKIENGRIA